MVVSDAATVAPTLALLPGRIEIGGRRVDVDCIRNAGIDQLMLDGWGLP
jgi:hypothetical protein